MTTMSWLCGIGDKHETSAWTMFLNVIYLVLLGLAIFLAIKDMGMVPHTATKIWVLALALFVPELFIILHGISTSSMSVNFFSGSPIEAHAGSFKRGASVKAAKAAADSLGLGLDSSDLTGDSSSSLF